MTIQKNIGRAWGRVAVNAGTMALIVVFMLSSTACSYFSKKANPPTAGNTATVTQTGIPATTTAVPENTGTDPKTIDTVAFHPNESGQVMIIMFHNFTENFTPTKSDTGEFTTTLADFAKLLDTLYARNFRMVSMKDFLDNNMKLKAGMKPVIFTFDDGTKGQFHFNDEGGKLVMDPKTAVGVMTEFNKSHPDFGMQGTFYINLGNASTFAGQGSMEERLNYLKEQGFELGNHTFNHSNLKKITTAEKLQEVIGKNQQKMEKLIPGYTFDTFSLPFGAPASELRKYVAEGKFESTTYKNRAIVLVGAGPAPSPNSPKLNPLALPRIRATGMKTVDADLAWWLNYIDKNPNMMYVSDGADDVVSVPQEKKAYIDTAKIGTKKLNVYK